uniref:7TM_GPCR_Srx domain-containing protein n=1 Tax=Panagrellus redivivus TaxID=6233 RepID=A0A7E4VYM9_PANRE
MPDQPPLQISGIFIENYSFFVISASSIIMSVGGILRNIMTYNGFLTSVCLGYCAAGTCIVSAALSVIHRFFFIFQPHNRKYFENKYSYAFIIKCHIIAYCVFAYFIVIDKPDESIIYSMARNASGNALTPYFTEPGFAVFRERDGNMRLIFRFIFYLIIFISFLFLGSIVFAIVQFFVSQRSKNTITKTTRSLLMTSLSQAALCVILLNGPTMFVIGAWGWNIPNSNTAANSAMLLLALHGTFDRISTLCFVSPYRKYIVSKFTGNCNSKIVITLSGQVSWTGGMAKVKP